MPANRLVLNESPRPSAGGNGTTSAANPVETFTASGDMPQSSEPGRRLEEIFAARVTASPNNVAISALGEQITYRELDRRARRLAYRLRKLGVARESLVALYLDRGIDLIVGLLGILKAGGAYLPIDTGYPAEGVRYILRDSQSKILVTSAKVPPVSPPHITCVCVDIDDGDDPVAEGDDSGDCQARSDDTRLAYVIYTSGSTGTPKGVMVEHRSVVRLFKRTEEWFRFSSSDSWTLFHSIGFDFSVWEIWGALLYGGRLVIVPQETTRFAGQFLALLAAESVTVLNQTPSAFRMLLAELKGAHLPDLSSLRLIVFGGESLSPALLRPWVEHFGDEMPELVNMYGITETTVHVTYRPIRTPDLLWAAASPIGVPIPDLSVCLLNQEGVPVPDGSPGEIYVSGPGLARGYLGDPALTADRFRVLSIGGDSPRMWYRSGDLAARTASGELFYAGRRDDQFKARGYRIEPQEIELCLAADDHVSACAVRAEDHDGRGDIRVVAYIALAPGTSWNAEIESSLVRRVADKLPEQMRPSSYVVVPEIPLNVNGKIDRAALFSGKSPHLRKVASRPAPRVHIGAEVTEIEAEIAKIWQEVLRRQGVGLHEDFFEIGGTSLAFGSMLNRVVQSFGINFGEAVLALASDSSENDCDPVGISVSRLARYVRLNSHTGPAPGAT